MSDNYSRLLNNDSGSNYSFADNIESASVPRSGFNLSYVTSGTADEGQLVPVCCKLLMMKEDYELKLQSIIKVVNPPKVALLSRQRVFYHAYKASFTQLWKNAQVFFSKGTSLAQTKLSRSIPKISVPVAYLTSEDLANFLGFNFASLPSSGTFELPALKFMFYLSVWRNYYLNKRVFSTYLYNRYHVDGVAWCGILYDFLFPEDESDFRIGSSQWDALIADSDCMQFLCSIKYRDYAPDYFTSSQLTPVIGEEPSIPIDINSATARFVSKVAEVFNAPFYRIHTVDTGSGSLVVNSAQNDETGLHGVTVSAYENSVLSAVNNRPMPTSPIQMYTSDGSTRLGLVSNISNTSPYTGNINTSALVTALNNSVGIDFDTIGLTKITQDTIRNLASATAILEKLAKTDGTYREFAKVMFGERPKSAYDFTPDYIGGVVQSILYTDVVNTTGSFNDSVPTSPVQGHMTGKGISAGSGDIGRFHSDDFGYLMIVMSIMPDTYYCQGLEKTDTYETPEDFYLPDRAKLGMQAILNKEIYNDPTSGDNDKVFAYQNRFDELRYNQNEVHGKLADPNNNSFFPYIQTRYFEACPTLSPEFLTTESNISKDWLTSVDEVPYIYQIAFNLRGVRPLPYRAEPEYFGL